MSLFDTILGQVGQNTDIANMAAKIGIDPAMAEKAIAALASAHTQPGDTVEAAAEQTGLDTGTMNQVLEHLGGEGALGQVSQMMNDHPQIMAGLTSMLDRDGDGSVLNDLAGMAKGFFGSKT